MCDMLKRILDEMYSEMCVLYEEKERWKREASELRGELEGIRNSSRINDGFYASEATAAPRSEVGSARAAVTSQIPAVTLQESACVLPVKEEIDAEVEVFNFDKEALKNVVILGNKQKCEDRKEYYKMYRLKQKELKASKK